MLHLTNSSDFPSAFKGGVLSIGNFDGVHLGHAKMLSTAHSLAKSKNLPFTIMTFDPHPSAILFPDKPRLPLTTLDQRLELLAQFSPDVLLIIPTSREFLSITPEEFLETVVKNALAATHLVEGPSFTFGRGAKGTIETLRALGPSHCFQTDIIPTQQTALSDLTQINVSSSLIRWLVNHGRVKDAAICLNRPYTLRAKVIHGAHRGRDLGFPTANLAPTQLIPAPAIYAGTATTQSNTTHKAAISIGNNPTFPGAAFTVEAHLLNFSGDLYNQTLNLSFHTYLRETLPYAGPAPLVAQIHRDIAKVESLS